MGLSAYQVVRSLTSIRKTTAPLPGPRKITEMFKMATSIAKDSVAWPWNYYYDRRLSPQGRQLWSEFNHQLARPGGRKGRGPHKHGFLGWAWTCPASEALDWELIQLKQALWCWIPRLCYWRSSFLHSLSLFAHILAKSLDHCLRDSMMYIQSWWRWRNIHFTVRKNYKVDILDMNNLRMTYFLGKIWGQYTDVLLIVFIVPSLLHEPKPTSFTLLLGVVWELEPWVEVKLHVLVQSTLDGNL